MGILGFIYVVITPESLTEKKIGTLTAKPKRDLQSLLVGVKIFLWPPYLGSRKLWRMWLAVLAMSLAVINEIGSVEILVYYLHNKPLLWDLTRISLYNVVISVTHCLALVVVLPVLVIVKLPDSLIALIGVTVACGVSITFGYAQNNWPYWVIFIGERERERERERESAELSLLSYPGSWCCAGTGGHDHSIITLYDGQTGWA